MEKFLIIRFSFSCISLIHVVVIIQVNVESICHALSFCFMLLCKLHCVCLKVCCDVIPLLKQCEYQSFRIRR